MRRLLIIVALLALACVAFADGFRGMPWGSSKEYVKTHETLDLLQDDDSGPTYEATVGGLDAYVFYYFTDEDHLYAGAYVFNEEHSNDNFYIDDFNKIEAILVAKYGAPSTSGPVWVGDSDGYDTDEYGLAVKVGDLKYSGVWNIGSSEQIKHTLTGDNYKANHLLAYISPLYLNEYQQDQQMKQQDGF